MPLLVHTKKTATLTNGNDHGLDFLDEIKQLVDKGWTLEKIWYDPQPGPNPEYYNATLTQEE